MAYMTRLGFWGEGTSFATSETFIDSMKKRGLGARRRWLLLCWYTTRVVLACLFRSRAVRGGEVSGVLCAAQGFSSCWRWS